MKWTLIVARMEKVLGADWLLVWALFRAGVGSGRQIFNLFLPVDISEAKQPGMMWAMAPGPGACLSVPAPELFILGQTVSLAHALRDSLAPGGP